MRPLTDGGTRNYARKKAARDGVAELESWPGQRRRVEAGTETAVREEEVQGAEGDLSTSQSGVQVI